MKQKAGWIASFCLVIILSQFVLTARSAWPQSASAEIAFVANAEAGTVALLDVAARSVLGNVDINPARASGMAARTPNFAQDTDISPDGRTLYVSRGYLGDVAAFDIQALAFVAAFPEHWPCRSHDAHSGRT